VKVRPVTGVAAVDRLGRLLLVQRSDDGTWGLPGGGLEPGESWSDAAVRECREETGWLVQLTGLLGIYSEPDSQIHVYPDGRRRHFVGVVFTAKVLQQVTDPDEESVAAGFFDLHGLPEPLFAPDEPVLADLASSAPRPFIR